MKKFLKSIGGKVCIVSLIVLLLAGIGCGYHYYLYEQRPKFHDVTIELGDSLPPVSDFLTEHAREEKASLLTPVEQINLSIVGKQRISFIHGLKTEEVILTIVDTTAPTAQFHDMTADISMQLKPEDFVTDLFDLSETTVTFAKSLEVPESYGDVEVEILVTDIHGNQISGRCIVHYVWMHKTYALELGDTLEKADLLLAPHRDADLLDQAVLDEINRSPVGVYTVSGLAPEDDTQCIVTVQDTVPPALELQQVHIDSYDPVDKDQFIVSVTDISGEVTTKLLTELDNITIGEHSVIIEAKDCNGNATTAETTLIVHEDSKAPNFYGVDTMVVSKNSEPDYKSGVNAWDEKEGSVSFTYDSSRVDLTRAGTYYVIYTAKDSKGNTATYRRKVVVDHDATDTGSLVSEIAAGLDSSIKTIRNYVYGTIGYSSNWGGDDPIWHGFKNRSGNCYVHALCLQALLKEKGYQTMLIWCEDKSHYWVLVYVDGSWKHTDSTPSPQHHKYLLMSDKQRHETLDGRDWDRSAWPACS